MYKNSLKTVFLFNRTYTAPIRYVTKTWSVVLLNKKKYIYSYLKCIVYDKLLKPRQSFRITLYLLANTLCVERKDYLKNLVERGRFVRQQMMAKQLDTEKSETLHM